MMSNRIEIGDVLRMPHYPTVSKGRHRVWLVVGQHLGGTEQEGTYELRCCDVLENDRVHVPCLILETHPGVFVYRVDKWVSLQVLRARHGEGGEG